MHEIGQSGNESKFAWNEIDLSISLCWVEGLELLFAADGGEVA